MLNQLITEITEITEEYSEGTDSQVRVTRVLQHESATGGARLRAGPLFLLQFREWGQSLDPFLFVYR